MTPPRACVEAVRHWMVTWYGTGVSDQHGAELVEAVLAAFVAGEPSPDARYRAEPLLGNRWAVTTHGVMLDICLSAEQARAVANVLNYLEAQRA